MFLIMIFLACISAILFGFAVNAPSYNGAERRFLFWACVMTLFTLFSFGWAMDELSCRNKWASTFPYRWNITTGCMIKPNDNWIPERNYREQD